MNVWIWNKKAISIEDISVVYYFELGLTFTGIKQYSVAYFVAFGIQESFTEI
jgi:hypothetical protein